MTAKEKNQLKLVSRKDIALALTKRAQREFSPKSVEQNEKAWGLDDSRKSGKVIFNPRVILYDAVKVSKVLIKAGIISIPLDFH